MRRPFPNLTPDIADIALFAGIAAIVAGCVLIKPWLGLIVGGLLSLGVSLLWSLGGKAPERDRN